LEVERERVDMEADYGIVDGFDLATAFLANMAIVPPI